MTNDTQVRKVIQILTTAKQEDYAGCAQFYNNKNSDYE